jgi:hypothetical protein
MGTTDAIQFIRRNIFWEHHEHERMIENFPSMSIKRFNGFRELLYFFC